MLSIGLGRGRKMELYGAIAILMVIGCFTALAWFFIRALRIETISINLIGYELLVLAFIVLGLFSVDYKLFGGGLLLNPLLGQGMMDSIHNVFYLMGSASSFVVFMAVTIVICVGYIFYYSNAVRTGAR